jgi:hypothetical protein
MSLDRLWGSIDFRQSECLRLCRSAADSESLTTRLGDRRLKAPRHEVAGSWARPAIDQVRVCHQSQDRQGARPRHSTRRSCHRKRGDRTSAVLLHRIMSAAVPTSAVPVTSQRVRLVRWTGCAGNSSVRQPLTRGGLKTAARLEVFALPGTPLVRRLAPPSSTTSPSRQIHWRRRVAPSGPSRQRASCR